MPAPNLARQHFYHKKFSPIKLLVMMLLVLDQVFETKVAASTQLFDVMHFMRDGVSFHSFDDALARIPWTSTTSKQENINFFISSIY